MQSDKMTAEELEKFLRDAGATEYNARVWFVADFTDAKQPPPAPPAPPPQMRREPSAASALKWQVDAVIDGMKTRPAPRPPQRPKAPRSATAEPLFRLNEHGKALAKAARQTKRARRKARP
jgi:hypothetical protein